MWICLGKVSYLAWLLTALPALAAPPHAHKPRAAAAKVPLYENLGHYHHAVTTSSEQAQRYFDQGLRLVYAFNHDEAIRAFKEAARLDPNCAMAYWGIALALGPNYNLPLDDPRNKAAYAAIQKAQQLAPQASPAEQAYIAALAKRYSLAPDADRKALDRDYASAMRGLAQQCPDDLDAATLFAESLMDLRPWDLWTLDGQPQPDTLEIVATLERVLDKDPNHPGANHYYIHAVEASPQPQRGLASAGRLGALMPGAGHLVHMPSHVYMRVGRYGDAADANVQAVAVDRQYIAQEKPQGVYPMMYYPHNIHFLWAAASMEGRSAEAVKAANELKKAVPFTMAREMPAAEYFMPARFFVLTRFGRWQEILAEPRPPKDLRYTTGMWEYARGRALVATNQLDAAALALARLTKIAAATPADRIIGDNTPAAAMLNLAAETLAGTLAARRAHTEEAVKHLTEAVRLQDNLPYTEPPPWYYPVRQTLGAVLVAAGRPQEAESLYREDLKRNPENGWSLFAVAEILRSQGDATQASEVEGRFRTAWQHADVQPNILPY